MDLTELWNTIERIKKEYAMSQEALKNDGVNHDIFVIDTKDLEIILEAAGYYYERAQMESTKYTLNETVLTKDGLTGIIDGIDNNGSPLYEPCYYVKLADGKTHVYSESQLKEITPDK